MLQPYVSKDITFHFIVCEPHRFVPLFIQQLRELGFVKPIAISYKYTVIQTNYTFEQASTQFLMPSISTDSLLTRGAYSAVLLRQWPELMENKVITYLVGDQVRQTNYRMMKQTLERDYGQYCRNRFALNYEVLNVVTVFLKLCIFVGNEITLDSNPMQLKENYKNLLHQIESFWEIGVDNTGDYAHVLLKMMAQLRAITYKMLGSMKNPEPLEYQDRFVRFSNMFDIEMTSIVWRKAPVKRTSTSDALAHLAKYRRQKSY